MDTSEVLRVLDVLDTAGIRVGITGGWGIDALLRRQTRPHGDLDLGIASDAVDAAVEALGSHGYREDLDEQPARLIVRSDAGQVDLHPILWGANGAGVQTGLRGETYDYPPGSLEAEGWIAGRTVRCGTPELQVAFHQGYEPTERDRADMAALATAFGLSLPTPYSD